jgi:hypothetical protein
VAPESGTRWRLAPFGSGALLCFLSYLTLGAGVLLAPVGVALTVVAFRRIRGRRPVLMWIGAILNGYLAVLFVWSIAVIVYEEI